MKKITYLAKNFIKSIFSIFILLINVYFGVLGFVAALLLDKLLIILGSKLTVDQILENLETISTQYKTNYDNFHFKDLKFKF